VTLDCGTPIEPVPEALVVFRRGERWPPGLRPAGPARPHLPGPRRPGRHAATRPVLPGAV